MKKYIIIFSFLAFVSILGIIYWFANRTENIMEEKIKNDIIDFPGLNEKIFISARAWGIAGNHEEIIFSSSPIRERHKAYSAKECYIFYTSEVFYKKEGIDTLLIYVASSSIGKTPKNFNSKKIKIFLVKLNTYDIIKDYNKNYKKYNLTKISVY